MDRRGFLGTLAASAALAAAPASPPLRLGMAGLAHGHASGFLGRYKGRPDVDLVGVSEPDPAVLGRYAARFGLGPDRTFDSLDAMLDRARPEGVVVFTDTFDHRAAVEACARRRIPVMMEKPLAIDMDHARAIERAAADSGIPVLVNYETTWYASNLAAYRAARVDGDLGEVRKVVFHDGHKGPKEIGVQPEFLAWLTDPGRNGAGALYDFGCYGANLMTWLMGDARPDSVTAVTRRFKPEVYPLVDDEATVILEYPGAQAILQASWNWPFDRKDMEIYGRTGSARTIGLDGLALRKAGEPEKILKVPPLAAPEDDFLRYFAAVIRGEIKPSGPSTLANNRIVAEILDAARRSAATGSTVRLA